MDESTLGESGCLIPGLPDGVSLECLARVPLLYRPRISAVCRNWRKIFQQKIFWDVRDKLCVREELLFLGLWSPLEGVAWYGLYLSTEQWFKLPAIPHYGSPPQPDRSRHRELSSYRFEGKFGIYSLACIDKKLFVIGGPSSHRYKVGTSTFVTAPSPSVCYFDLKLWQWKRAGPLHIARVKCNTGIVNNELYVCGGFAENYRSGVDNVEVYNLNTQTWRLVDRLDSTEPSSRIRMDGNFWWNFSLTDSMPFSEFRKNSNTLWIVWRAKRGDVALPTGLYYHWPQKPVELNGKWYMKCVTNVNLVAHETFILLYNLVEDVWEDFLRFCSRGMLEENPKRVLQRWAGSDCTGKLMAINGMLYIARENDCACGTGTVFEIKDLTGRRMISRSFNCDRRERIHGLHMPFRMDERCEVVTL